MNFYAEVRQGQKGAVPKALKKARYDQSDVFKLKSNKTQAAFNSKVDQTLAQAEDDIAPTPVMTPAIQRLLETIQKVVL